MARRRVEQASDLDVLPVMSLIVHLIPMLLLAVRFVTLSQVPASGPVLPSSPAPSSEAFEEQEEKVVSVQITPEGFVVGGGDAVDPRIPCNGGCTPDTYDYASLNRALIAAKRLHPTENRVVLAPGPTIAYDVLVRVMEASRARGDNGELLFPAPLIAAGAP